MLQKRNDNPASVPAGQWYVYMLQCRGGCLYTGSTNNLEKRLQEHERGAGSRFVRSRLPFEVVKKIPCSGKSEALRLESRLKVLRRRRKIEMIELDLDGAGYLRIVSREKDAYASEK